MQKFIAYYRVSTKKQGQSGLGLEGQEAATLRHCSSTGGQIIATYTEVESGKLAERPELAKALSHAKRSKATLVVAKLDRLARNVAFLSSLMESGVDFVACDNPNANRLTVHILAAVAEDEAQRISDRTKAALAAAKARGMKLGSSRDGHWEGNEHRRLAGAKRGAEAAGKAHRAAAQDAYRDLLPSMTEMKKAGHSLREIAAWLTAEGHTTRNGKDWNQVQVMRVLAQQE